MDLMAKEIVAVKKEFKISDSCRQIILDC